MPRQLCDCCNGRGVLDGVDENYGRVFTCPECRGAMFLGLEDDSECPMCEGTGGLLDGTPAHPDVACEDCRQCGGSGRIQLPLERPTFTVRDTIPVPDEAPTEPCITYLPELEDAEGWS